MQQLARSFTAPAIRLPDPSYPALPRAARLFLAEYRKRCAGEPTGPITLANASQRLLEKTNARIALCSRVQQLCDENGQTHTANVHALMHRIRHHQEPPQVLQAAALLATARSGGPYPGDSSVLRWYSDWKASDYDDNILVDQHRGRRPIWHGWEELALSCWLQHGSPSQGDVLFWLQEHYGIKSVSASRLRYFIDNLPATLGPRSKYRIGHHNWRQNESPFKVRDTSRLPAGFEYEGDGHMMDIIIAHPRTGNPVRFELTVFLDVRSQKVVAWNVWIAESALNTLFTLARSIQALDHVPRKLHVDPGPGFDNKQVERYLELNNIETVFAHPGNARGKGLVEGWFKQFEAKCGRLFSTYCGHGRVDDALERLRLRIKRGEIVLPTLEQLIAVIGDYIEKYNARPKHGKLAGKSPNQVWAETFIQEPPAVAEDAEIRLRVERTVRNGMVQMTPDPGLPPRRWTHPELIGWNHKKVIVEYSPFSFDTVTIRHTKGRKLVEAYEIDRPDAVSEHEMEASERRRTAHRTKRLEEKLREVEDQQFYVRDFEQAAREVLDPGDSTLIEHHHNPLNSLHAVPSAAPSRTAANEPEIDLLDTDY